MKINLMPFWRALWALLTGKKPKPKPPIPPPDPIPVPPVPPVPVLPALQVNGKWFETAAGEPWSQVACTDFRLLQRFLNSDTHNGDDLDPILAQRRDLGFNQVRVLGMCELMFQLHPQRYPNYYGELVAFAEKLQGFGLRWEFTVFADATRVMPDLAEQQAHFARVCEVLRPFAHMTFLELVNENDQVVNVMQTDFFLQPDGFISCHGSLGADAHPGVEPLWSYGTIHPARPPDWPRKAAHNPMEDIADRYGIPATTNEMCRPNQGRGPVPSDHFDAAAGSALLHNGSTFHSEAGKFSELFDGDELACAEGYIRGARAVPLRYRYGTYTGGHLHDSPIVHHPVGLEEVANGPWWSSRTFFRILGNEACGSVCQKTADWRLVLNDGWTVVRETESVIELTR